MHASPVDISMLAGKIKMQPLRKNNAHHEIGGVCNYIPVIIDYLALHDRGTLITHTSIRATSMCGAKAGIIIAREYLTTINTIMLGS